MAAVLISFALGLAPGYFLRNSAVVRQVTGWVTRCAVWILLFLLGAALGGNETVFRDLPILGARAVFVGFLCTMGSVLAAAAITRRIGFSRNDACGVAAGREASLRGALLGSGIILGCFFFGLALSRLGLLPQSMRAGEFTTHAIILLMFTVGMSIGFDLSALGILRQMREKALLLPLVAVLGTFAGALAAALLLPGMGLRETAGVGFGFGYYSLSSLIITGMGDAPLGSVALMSNIFRELFTIVTTPLLVRFFGPLAPIAAGGATSMDTTLPGIVRYSGERCGILSVFSAIVLTLLVPVLVPAALRFF